MAYTLYKFKGGICVPSLTTEVWTVVYVDFFFFFFFIQGFLYSMYGPQCLGALVSRLNAVPSGTLQCIMCNIHLIT